MSQEIIVPDIGDYQEVEVIEVIVKKGDSINQEDPLLVLETNKATMEVPADTAGVVSELLVKVGDKVSQGSPILKVEGEGKDAKADKPKTDKSANKKSEAPKPSANAGADVVRTVPLPDIGDYDVVDVIEVLVKPGDKVEQDQPLVILETDKATMEIPSPFAGVVKEIQVEVGNKVSAGDTIAALQVNDAAVEVIADAPVAQEASDEVPVAKAETAVIAQPETASEIYASPGVRRMASKMGVDLSTVIGMGRKGRITQDDLADYLKQNIGAGTGGGLAVAPLPEVDYSKFGEVETQALNRVKQLTAEAMHRNWVTIPHITLFDETDIVELEVFRKSQKESALAQGMKLTPLAFIVKALAKILREFPEVNSSLNRDGKSLTLKSYVHIGFAVDTPAGLMVPVIKNANQKGVFDIARDIIDLSSKARDGKLAGSDMQGGSFTVSSLGNLGTQYFTPIINAPEVGILGVSKAYQKPVCVDGQFVPRLYLPLSLSLDHRVVDGAEGARFFSRLNAVLTDVRQLIL